jgi:hypothetical protein
MAHGWSRADHAGLVRLIRLIDAIERGEATASLAAEVRLGEDRFGLSPKGRQQLRWALPGEPVPVRAEDRAERAERERARKARVMEMLRDEQTT